MNTYLETNNKKSCTSCTACKEICPKDCITMEEDDKGFYFPSIDNERCINCGLCRSVCPTDREIELDISKMYAVISKDENVVAKSTSGGAFTLLSDEILKNNGVIFGAIYDENMNVIHSKAEDYNQRDKMRTSKYVMSLLGNTFKEVKKNLDEGKQVLFTGTSCQIHGLLGYLKKDYDNLITVDFLCSGTPSPKVYNMFINEIEKKYNKKVIGLNFRNKKYGWDNQSIKITFNDNSEEYINLESTSYYRMFACGYSIKESCGDCRYASYKRVADITIGDFWGIKEYMPEMYNENKGVSVITLNSTKGMNLFEKIKDNSVYKECDIIKANQVRFSIPPLNQRNRDVFFEYLKHKTLERTGNIIESNKFIHKVYRKIIKIKMKKGMQDK